MAKLSYKERSRQRREQEILRTAARLIRDHGYINLNMDELADEVGISKPTLYQHFKGKDDMVAKAMIESIEKMREFVLSVEGSTAIAKLESIMRYMLEAHADPEGYSLAIMRESTLVLRHLKDENSIMTETQKVIGNVLYALVEQAKSEGDIRTDIPGVLVISIMFASLSILEGPAIMRDHRNDVKELIDQTVAFFCRGLAPGQ